MEDSWSDTMWLLRPGYKNAMDFCLVLVGCLFLEPSCHATRTPEQPTETTQPWLSSQPTASPKSPAKRVSHFQSESSGSHLSLPSWHHMDQRRAVLWALSKLQIHGQSNGRWCFKLLSLEAIYYTAENNWYRVPNPNPPSSVVFSEVSKTLSLPSISPAPFQVFLHEILQHLLLIIISNHFIIINHHFPTIRRVI